MRISTLKLPSQSWEEESSPSLKEDFEPKEDQVSPIRGGLVALTGNHYRAVILNQLLYWTPRVKDFASMLEEERTLGPYVEQDLSSNGRGQDQRITLRHGWIYKTAGELIKETLLTISQPTMRKYLKQLNDQGWIEERSNPINKWNKTTQYRVNLRKVQKQLLSVGLTLPHAYLRAFLPPQDKVYWMNSSPLMNTESSNAKDVNSKENSFASNEVNFPSDESLHIPSTAPLQSEQISNERNFGSNESSYTVSLRTPPESEEISKQKIFASKQRNLHSDERNFASNLKNFPSKQRIFGSNLRNFASYTYTETTPKNTNKEHTQDACVREDFKNSILMVDLWCKHIGQEVRLTEERKHQLEALFCQHFQSDLPQWTRFCQRIQASPFLMGEGARKWRVSLDWILSEGNALKVLEGNFDDSESLQLKKSEGTQIDRNQERAEILTSIQEPTWQDWCAQLSCRDQQKDPVSLFALQEIANANFAEFDGKLVWIESEDPKVLSRINDLRLQLLSIAQRSFPQARNIRTQLRAGRPFALLSKTIQPQSSIQNNTSRRTPC